MPAAPLAEAQRATPRRQKNEKAPQATTKQRPPDGLSIEATKPAGIWDARHPLRSASFPILLSADSPTLGATGKMDR